jgi:serine/threonine-protein kinase
MTFPSPRRREPNDLPAGTVVNGKFRVVSLLATGGMGRIYQAEQVPLGRVVALKVLRAATTESEAVADEFRKRFFREASILARLQHVNVVTLFDYGRIEGAAEERYFIAMEYLAGETLAKRLRRSALPVGDALRVLRHVARGLREAHKLGAVHRDLKPSNVMLVPQEDGDEIVKILDFGIGKIVGGDDDDEDLTQQGAFLGSPKYIAPEQVNERRVDARTDVYALGVIGYECLCGRVPFEGETNLETIMAHCHGQLKPMAERSPGVVVPDVVEAFVRRCLEKEPDRRPQSMEEVVRAIGECERALFGRTSLIPGGDSGPPPSLPSGPAPMAGAPLGSSAPPQPAAPPSGWPSAGTASPLTRSQHAATASKVSHAVAAVALAGVVVVLCAGAVVVRVARRAKDDRTTVPSATSAAAAMAPASFTLVLDSRPSGAEVWDGDTLLGSTPVQVTVDRTRAKNGGRRFVLRLDGYMPYTLLQGDSEGVVQVTAPLTPLAAASVGPSASASVTASVGGAPSGAAPSFHPRWGMPRTSSSPASSTHTAQQDLDIKLER